MGNCCCCTAKESWMAKESYFPDQDTEIGGHKLLQFGLKDKLKMLDDKIQIERDMYLMRNLRTKEEGLVSKIKVGRIGTIDFEPWYFGDTSRRKAESYLADGRNNDGAFLVRDSSQPNQYSLSLKVYETTKAEFIYKHYLIKCRDGEYFISDSSRYNRLEDLVKSYQKTWNKNLPTKLSSVCFKPSDEKRGPKDTTEWNIPASEIVKGEKLGGGCFGTVSKGMYKGVHVVAIKELDEAGAASHAKEFLNETNILKSLHHPNLVQVIGVCTEHQWIVLEFLPGGDLIGYLRDKKNGRASTSKLIEIAEDIACGMRELERVGVVHRDLAARNVLLDDWCRAKVSDFGLAREGNEYSARDTKIPYKWCAIESLKHKKFTIKSDVWSFGVVLWEIFSLGDKPYQGIRNSELLKFLTGNNRLPVPTAIKDSSTTQAMYKIMLACWHEDPAFRPTMTQIHSSMKNFEEDEVLRDYDVYSKYIDDPPTDARTKAIGHRKKRGEPGGRVKPEVKKTTKPPNRPRIKEI